MLKAVLFALFIALSYGQFAYQANKNITVNNQDFNYRDTQSEMINAGGFEAFFFKSLSVSRNNNSATVDGVFGAAYATFGLPPSAYLAFYHAASMWNTQANGAMTADVSASDGFIGKSFLFLDEINPNGTMVNRVQFDRLFWQTANFNTGNGGLKHFGVTANSGVRGNNLNVTVYFIISDVAGVLNVTGQPVVTPKSLESMVLISNYTYKSPANSLKLTIGVGTGEANVQIARTMTSGNGTSRTYFTLQGTAQVDGQVKTVNVSGFTNGGANTMNNNIATQVTAKYAAAASFKLVTVTFPPGAEQIMFDPNIGVGAMPEDSTTGTTDSNAYPSQGGTNTNAISQGGQENSARFVIPSILVLLATLLLAAF